MSNLSDVALMYAHVMQHNLAMLMDVYLQPLVYGRHSSDGQSVAFLKIELVEIPHHPRYPGMII